MTRNARIIGTGMWAPERVVPNSWFDQQLGENVSEWLEENLTIRERRWCAETESTADLATNAGRAALENAGISPDELELVIVATDTPEYISPATSAVVQYRLGAVNAGCFDLNAACSGFVAALDTGAKAIRADRRTKRVLVIGAYAMSKYLDLTDKKTVTLFADGAGAVVLEEADGSVGTGGRAAADAANRGDQPVGWLSSRLSAAGEYHDWMGIYAGGTHMPVDSAVLERKDHLLRFVRKFPKEINPTTWERLIREVLRDAEASPADVSRFFFTQININSIHETMEGLGVPSDRAHTIMDRYGYTGSACIPMALADADARSLLAPGDLVVFMGSGGGLAFACAAFRW
ncbi:MAG: ketoacyl-ACP synthase III [Candidatus Eisenbacteria bacterium]